MSIRNFCHGKKFSNILLKWFLFPQVLPCFKRFKKESNKSDTNQEAIVVPTSGCVAWRNFEPAASSGSPPTPKECAKSKQCVCHAKCHIETDPLSTHSNLLAHPFPI